MQTKKIDREELMELTRRMTVKRNCFSRIAGAYIDKEGWVDGTFHTHFGKLKEAERAEKLSHAKAVLFGDTNVQVQQFPFSKGAGFQKMLLALRECELKNDGMLDVLYEQVAQNYSANKDYAILFYYGSYDVPRKATDKTVLEDSEEVYNFMVCACCPLWDDYELSEPDWGFLYPAFTERSNQIGDIVVYQKEKSVDLTWLYRMIQE